MVKLITLRNDQLKELLRENDLDTTGTKAIMAQRLEQFFGTDEVDSTTLNNQSHANNENLQSQLDNMNVMMQTLLQTVQQLGEQVKTSNAQNSKPTSEANADENNDEPETPHDEPETPHDEHSDEVVLTENIDNVSVASSSRYLLPRNRPKHHYSVKEIAETIPEFDPTKETSVTAEQFVQHVEGSIKAYEWDDKSLLLAVYSRFKGVARPWFDCRSTLFSNWREFKDELLDEFGLTLDEAEVSAKMRKTTRRSDEKVIDYCFRIHTIGRQWNLSEAAIIRYAREGMKHRDIQTATATKKFKTMKEFREAVNEYFANTSSFSRQTKEYIGSRPNNSVKPLENHETVPTQRKNNINISCYNCNEKGHVSRNCPLPQKKDRCNFCQRTSHKSGDCPNKQQNITTKPTINAIHDSDETYKDVIANIKVNGKNTTAFMDSGSPASLIRKTYAGNFGELLECCWKKLSGFAGGTYIVTQMLPTIVCIDGNDYKIVLLVVEDEDIPEDVLIGRDLLCKKGNRLVIENGKCRIENTEVSQVASIIERTHNDELQKLLLENRHCIADEMSELGKCSIETMKISLTTDVPVNLKPYRIAFAKREVVANIIKELLNCNIIRPSRSHYASPVVLVAKKSGEHRLCVDYRALNKITRRTPFPMPNLEEQFAQLSGNSYFSTLDLRMGYHQIEMDENSKQYTAFVTTDGHYEYNRMPFGLVNAPAVFQRVMNAIMAQMNPGEALVYLDDVIIPSNTIQEGMHRLRKLLKLLSESGLTLRLDKCQFLATEIEHLGHIVNGDGIRPGNNKINAIRNFKIPGNVTEVRRFMGLTGFFRKFVPDYSIIIKPITKLLHKAEADNFNWADEQQQAFDQIIYLLTNAPILVLYDVKQSHEVHTDACAIGLAGVLLQSEDEKDWRPVMYYSRHCTAAEQSYHSYELEVLAVVESLERFRLYLLGKNFRVVTDCSAITQTKEERELKPRIARWWLKMQEYTFDIVHRPGTRMAHVDALSRAPVDDAITCEPAGHMYNLTDQQSDWVVAMQQRDERVKYIVRVLTGKEYYADGEQIRREYELVNGRLYYKIGEEKKFYVPKAVRWNLVAHYHDNMGHFAIEKTLQRLKKLFWFPKMRKWVKEYIKACISCCYNKGQRSKPEGELHFSEPTPIPFRTLHIDHLGPFIRSRKGNTYLLVITDAFSKFCIMKAVKSTKTIPVIAVLKEVFGYFGLADKIISDRGTAFTSKLFETYCVTNHIRHIKTAVRTPRANGQVERSNATILDAIRTSTDNPKNWDENLEQLQWAMNSQANATTHFTPNELIFNYDLKDVIHNHLVAAVMSDGDVKSKLTTIQKRNEALKNIEAEREKWKLRFDKKHAKPTEYEVGDLVVIRVEPTATGESRKLEAKFRGPYAITRCLGNDRYAIGDVPGVQITNRAFDSVYSSDHIKRWCHGYPELAYDDDIDDESDIDETNLHSTL